MSIDELIKQKKDLCCDSWDFDANQLDEWLTEAYELGKMHGLEGRFGSKVYETKKGDI